LALNAAVGAVAVQEDLPTFHFGWRQMLPFAAVVGVALAVVPVLHRSLDGSWGIPSESASDKLSWMADQANNSSFRVVWLGDPNSMPGGPRRLDDNLAAAVSVNGPTVFGPALPSRGGDGQEQLATAVSQAESGLTVELGKLIAPLSVRYVVVPNDKAANERAGNQQALITALSDQLDLRQVAGEPELMVFENLEYLPSRAELSPQATLAAHAKDEQTSVDLGKSRAVLPKTGSGEWSGPIEQGEVFVGEQNNSSWDLTVNGHQAQHTQAFGWANAFKVTQSGNATLKYNPPIVLIAIQVFNAVIWIATLIIALRYRIRLGRWA
jgi:hypothetical protein